MSNDTTTPTTLENVTCSRCGGSGSYGPTCVYGGRCFRCHGSGKTYTKRGLVALAYLNAIRSRPASALAVGDKVRVMSITAGGQPYDHWAYVMQVVEVADVNEGRRSWTNGVEVVLPVTPGRRLIVELKKGSGVACLDWQVGDDTAVRVAQNADQAKETFARALAYQGTLTKAGTPRKR